MSTRLTGRPASLRERVRETKPVRFLREIRESWRRTRSKPNQVVSLRPDREPQGNVLLSYILDPFLLKPGEPVSNAHSNHWESLLMARVFLDLGYAVDVISWLNDSFVPCKPYKFFVDVRWNMQRLSPLLNPDCQKALHIDVCHILFQNAAESQRLLAVQQRRGATLRPRRFEWPNLAIEHADWATILGNRFTVDTFRYAQKPIYPVPIIPSPNYPWPEEKDFDSCRRNFLWFGSGGLVRKGLDLVLEAFAGMPEFQLTVCGPVNGEPDFEEAYFRELYQTPNIKAIGWVDVGGAEFLRIARQSLGLVYPSCAEGQCGGVITCLHTGVLPMISYETGVDVHDFGVVFPECSVAEIRRTVRSIASLPADQLKGKARKGWEFARSKHTHEAFTREYRTIVEMMRDRTVQKKLPAGPRSGVESRPSNTCATIR